MVNALFTVKVRFAVDFPKVLHFLFPVPVVGPLRFVHGKNVDLDL